MHAFDRQTDRQKGRTDRILIATPRLHAMQSGKNLHTSRGNNAIATFNVQCLHQCEVIVTWSTRY